MVYCMLPLQYHLIILEQLEEGGGEYGIFQKMSKTVFKVNIFFFFLSCATWHVGSSFPDQ